MASVVLRVRHGGGGHFDVAFEHEDSIDDAWAVDHIVRTLASDGAAGRNPAYTSAASRSQPVVGSVRQPLS